jgi:hypothetical protein
MQNDLVLPGAPIGDHATSATLLLLADVTDEATLAEIIADVTADAAAGYPISGVDPTNIHASWIHVVACTSCQSNQRELLGYAPAALVTAPVTPVLSDSSVVDAQIAAAVAELGPATHAATPQALDRKPAKATGFKGRRRGLSSTGGGVPEISSSSGGVGIRLPWVLAALAVIGGVAITFAFRSPTRSVRALPASTTAVVETTDTQAYGAAADAAQNTDTALTRAKTVTPTSEPVTGDAAAPAQAKKSSVIVSPAPKANGKTDSALQLEPSKVSDTVATDVQKESVSTDVGQAGALVESNTAAPNTEAPVVPGAAAPSPASASAVEAAISLSTEELGTFASPAGALAAFATVQNTQVNVKDRRQNASITDSICPAVVGTPRARATVENAAILLVRTTTKAGLVDVAVDEKTCTQVASQEVALIAGEKK